MPTNFEISDDFIAEQNSQTRNWIEEDFEHLGKKLRRQNVDIEDLVKKAAAFRVAIPSWGVGTGGTRFARFAGEGEPRDIYDEFQHVSGPAGSNAFIQIRQPYTSGQARARAGCGPQH